MATYRSAEFFRALPALLRSRLPVERRKFHTRLRNWMLQVYYDDASVHYEASALNRPRVFEVALHFERRGRELNDALLSRFMPHVFALKAELGAVEFEPWDKGWSKIYTTLPLETYTEAYLERVADCLAHLITYLQPILDDSE